MAVSEAYKILWGTSIVFVILPHLNLGLLSDYKICGDSACESLMSRVQAIRDHQGKDCRFLSFRQGDTIFVYHKLTGKREDLWAGSMDKQFGYFPKDAVQEEQVYATVEKVVETQESDFFCMDEFGYPIDSSHLDSDDNTDDDDDQKIQNQESEITQTTLYTDDTNVESLPTSEDPSTESPVSAQEAKATLTEEDENKNTGDAVAGTHEEAQETPAAPNEQGGSAPSSWLGSSVTGWLGLAKEEEAGNLAEGEKKDERKEAQARGSVASSVTGWLGLGGDSTPDDAAESREQDGESTDSFTSTMTGWLGFGGEKKMDDSVEKEQDEERENDEEPAETFRSRRMSLDLEGSQLHEEEKKEMGTLGWLGNGLSSTLGFGLTNQESGLKTTTEIEAKEEEQPAPGSWLDMGIGDILGFGKDKSEVDESTGSGFQETEDDTTLEQPTSSENMDTSQSQPALTEEITTNESKVEETPKDQDVLSEIEVSADSDDNDISTFHSSKDSVPPEDAASKIDQNDITPQTKSEKTPQAVDGMSSMLNNSEEEEEDSVSDTGERSEEMEGKDYEMLKSIENESEDKNREPGEQETKTASDTDQDFFTQSDINLGPDVSSVDLAVNSMGGSVGDVEEDKTEEEIEEVAKIPNQISATEESTDSSVKIGASSHEGERNNAETDVLHGEISTTKSQVSRGGESQSFLSPGTAVERNEPIYSEDDSLPAHSVETSVDHSESLAMIDSNTDTETQQGELGQEGELHPVEGSSQEVGSSHTDRGTEMMDENVSEEDRRMFTTSESTTQMANNADQDSSPHVQQGATQSDGDEHELKETPKENEKDSEDKVQTVQTEKETMETESDKVVDLKEGEKQGEKGEIEEEEKLEELKEAEEINAQEKQQEVEEEKQNEVEGLKEEGKQEEVEEKEQERVDELEKEVVHELREKEKQEEADKIKEEDNQKELRELKEEENQKEGEELDEMSKNDKMEEIKGEKTQVEIEELKKEENKEVVEEWEENKEQEEVDEIKEEDNAEEVKELKGEETQGEGEELNEKDKNDEMEEMKEEKKQEEVEEFEENKKQEEVEEIKEEERVGELKEEEKKHKEVEVLTEEEKLQIEELKEEESREELKEVGGVKDEEKKEGEEKQVQSHLEVEMENNLHSLPHTQKDIDSPETDSDEKETQDEDSSESVFSELSTETERRQTENPQMEEQETGGETQERVEEVKDEEKQEMENVEDERRGKEEERGLKCSDELCPQASEDVFVRDRDGNDSANRLSSVDEDGIEAEKQNPAADDDQILADGTGVSQTVPSESMERDEDGIQEEEEKEEKRDDDKKENDLLYSGESGLNSLPDQLSLGQTAESKEDDQVSSSEADETDLSDDNRLHQGATTEPEDTETSSNGISTDRKTEQIHSGHETDSEEDTVREETEINMKHADMQMMSQDYNTVGSEFRTEGGIDVPVLSSDPVISEQTVIPDGHNKEAAETGGGGAFGLFKNAFSFFSQSPVAENEGSTESAPSLDSNTGETSNAQTSLTPEQEPDSTTNPSQVYIQDSHTESPITVSQQQLQPSPPSTETQTSSLSPMQTHSHPTESPLQTKPNTKHSKNLLAYMSADETTILTELFGRHKLQFLDFILGSSESLTDDPDNDESILLDIERLLHYHRETLVAPSMKLSDAPQEDKEKTRTLIALQKLEMLLANVRETLSAAEASCVGGSCSSHSKDKEMAIEEDNNAPRDEWMGMDKEKDGELSGGTGNEKRGEKGKISEDEGVSPESHSHIQPGPPQSLEGVMKQILDFVLPIAEDSITHVHAVRELLIWFTVQVRVVG